MATIIVYEQPEIADVIIHKNELDLLYEKFTKDENLDKHHFQSILEMIKYEIITTDINSNINIILIKKILQYCKPIIKEIPEFNIKLKTVDKFNVKKNIVKNVYYNIPYNTHDNLNCLLQLKQQLLKIH